jgi:thiamine pyrophosphokinase
LDVYFLKGPNTLDIKPDTDKKILSLIPLSKIVRGLSLTGGFKYPLNKNELFQGLTLGLSNELNKEGGYISFEKGDLLVMISAFRS